MRFRLNRFPAPVAAAALALLLGWLPVACAEDQPTAYNLIQGERSAWDDKVDQILGPHYRIVHFQADDHRYEGPVVQEGERPSPLYVMEEGNPVMARGKVYVFFVIGADGSVEFAEAELESGCECLLEYLSEEMKKVTYLPARLDGAEVASTALQILTY